MTVRTPCVSRFVWLSEEKQTQLLTEARTTDTTAHRALAHRQKCSERRSRAPGERQSPASPCGVAGLVPDVGLEPTRLSTTHFECAASTDSANPAFGSASGVCPAQKPRSNTTVRRCLRKTRGRVTPARRPELPAAGDRSLRRGGECEACSSCRRHPLACQQSR